MAVGGKHVGKSTHGKVLLLAQEIEFAKILAGNDKRLRDRGIKRLKKWLMARSSGKCEFTDDDFLRIWKGIFYCMWMADKLLVQEELAETISNLIHCFSKPELAVSFIKCFFRTIVLEWYGIDQFRYDKFMMLVRRFLRQTFKFCRKNKWEEDTVSSVCNAFTVTVLSSSKSGATAPPLSLVLHFCDIYLQELAKVGKEKIPKQIVTAFLQPFMVLLSAEENGIIRNKIVRDIFHNLMKQSDAAVEFTEKWKAWKSAGCPGKSWEDMEKVVDEEEMKERMDLEDLDVSDSEILENEPLDPRAGKVDVELPQIPFDSQNIAEAMLLQVEKCSSRKYSKALEYLAKKFMELAEGKYPLAKSDEKNVLSRPKIEKFKLKSHINKAASHLRNFEEQVERRSRKRSRKKKKMTSKKEKVQKSEISADDNNSTLDTQQSVVESLEKISEQDRLSPDSCIKDTNNATDSSLKQNSRKRKNSGPEAVDGEITNIEPKLKVKKKNSIVNGVETGANSLHTSTPLKMKRAAIAAWEVSDVKEDSPQKKSIEESPFLASGAIEVESVVNSKKDTKTVQKATTLSTAVANKKVNIVLNKNSSQDLQQYQMSVLRSPAIPFDGSKQPGQGVLKPSPAGSHINPFYRSKVKKLLDS